MFEAIVFFLLSGVVLGSALCTVLMRNVLHSALFLGLSLAGVAGIFATLSADFLFGAQILIYVSGIAVLILFVVLLSGRASDLLVRQVNEQWFAAAAVCALIGWAVLRVVEPFTATRGTGPMEPTTEALGRLLLGDLAFPFELVSIVLLAALVGAVYFTQTDREPS